MSFSLYHFLTRELARRETCEETDIYFNPQHNSFCSLVPPLLLTFSPQVASFFHLHSCGLAVVVVVVSMPCCGGHEWLSAPGAILTLAHSRLVAPLPSRVPGTLGEERCPVCFLCWHCTVTVIQTSLVLIIKCEDRQSYISC